MALPHSSKVAPTYLLMEKYAIHQLVLRGRTPSWSTAPVCNTRWDSLWRPQCLPNPR